MTKCCEREKKKNEENTSLNRSRERKQATTGHNLHLLLSSSIDVWSSKEARDGRLSRTNSIMNPWWPIDFYSFDRSIDQGFPVVREMSDGRAKVNDGPEREKKDNNHRALISISSGRESWRWNHKTLDYVPALAVILVKRWVLSWPGVIRQRALGSPGQYVVQHD